MHIRRHFAPLLFLTILAGCAGPQDTDSLDEVTAETEPPSEPPPPDPPPPELVEQAPSCVVRPTKIDCSGRECPGLIEAFEATCNSPVNGVRLSTATDGTRQVAFRLGESSGHQPAAAGLWTIPPDHGGAVQILPILGGFPTLATDEGGVAHLVRIESESVIYYHCVGQDPMRWPRRLVKRLSGEEYPSSIVIDGEGTPRVLLQRWDQLVVMHQLPSLRWRERRVRGGGGAVTSRLVLDQRGDEHLAFWSPSPAGGLLKREINGVSTSIEPRAYGWGVSLRTLKTAEMPRPRQVIGFKGRLPATRDGAHVLLPVGETEHLDLLFAPPAEANGNDCPALREVAPGQALQCQKRQASVGYPRIATQGDDAIWLVYVTHFTIRDVELSHVLASRQRSPRAAPLPPPEREVGRRTFQRLSVVRISPSDGSAELMLSLERTPAEGFYLGDPSVDFTQGHVVIALQLSPRSTTLLRFDPRRAEAPTSLDTEPIRYELFSSEQD